MKTRQYSVKVFEIELTDEAKFIAFFEKNYQFFQNHLIVINGEENKQIQEYLNTKQLKHVFNLTLPKRGADRGTTTPIPPEPAVQKETTKPKEKIQTNLKVLDKLIRSGQELKIDGDLLLLNRVNSGGSIIIKGTLIITQIVDGSIRCDGNFMMLQASHKANIVFHGVEVDNKFLQDKLNRVELINNEIVITPVLKETSWV